MNQRIHVRHAVENFVEHYNTERAHQSLGNKMINPGIEIIIEKQRKMVVIEFPDTTG